MTSTGHCKATNKNGSPCRGFAQGKKGYCFAHCPDQLAARKEARSKGGFARHGRKIKPTDPTDPITILSVLDVTKLLETEINTVLDLERSIARARTIGYLAGVALRSLEVGEIEERLKRLEERLNEKP